MAGKEVIMITETARAKINLTLWVGRKRPDGYHSIDSVMHSISLSDEITLEKSNEILLTVLEGDAPAGQENLMVRAAEAFFAVTELEGGVFLTLKKRIPSGAGMGGGSADAAAVLRGLSKAYEHPLSKEDLLKVAARIGADVPFCVEGGASRCQGIGEILTPARAWEGRPVLRTRSSMKEKNSASTRQKTASKRSKKETGKASPIPSPTTSNSDSSRTPRDSSRPPAMSRASTAPPS